MSLGPKPFHTDGAPIHLTDPQTHSQSIDDDQDTYVPSPAPSEEIGQLARYLSSQEHHTGDLFDYEKDSVLDPFGNNFDARIWVSKFVKLEDWASVQDRKSGISFKDLTVFGYGTDAGESISAWIWLMIDYQKTVSNLPLSWISAARGLVQTDRRRRVNILNGVDGVLEAGEMLVVLGPPGR